MTVKYCDFHVHSGLLKHTQGSITEFVKEAKKLGFSEIAFTEHFSKKSEHLSENWEFLEEESKENSVEKYFEKIEETKKLEKRIKIIKGIEVDYFPGIEREASKFLKKAEYCVGAVHHILDKKSKKAICVNSLELTFFSKKKGIEKTCEIYFSQVKEAASTGFFNSIAHLDLIKTQAAGYSLEKAMPFVEDVLEEMVRKRVGLEINTKSFFKFGEDSPSKEIVERFIELGGKKIFPGSDAHSLDLFMESSSRVKMLCKEYCAFLGSI